MKTTLKIIEYKDGMFGAKRKTLFGYRYLNIRWSIMQQEYIYTWAKKVPNRNTDGDLRCRFGNEYSVVNTLSDYFHGYRHYQEKT